MAKELTVSAFTISYTKGSSSFTRTVAPKTIDVAGQECDAGIERIVGTAEEALFQALDDVAAGGVWIVANLELPGGNKVSLRASTGATNFMDILPGEEWPFRLATAATAPFAIATTAAVRVRITRVDP
jgi:hypothetical protein